MDISEKYKGGLFRSARGQILVCEFSKIIKNKLPRFTGSLAFSIEKTYRLAFLTELKHIHR